MIKFYNGLSVSKNDNVINIFLRMKRCSRFTVEWNVRVEGNIKSS